MVFRGLFFYSDMYIAGFNFGDELATSLAMISSAPYSF